MTLSEGDEPQQLVIVHSGSGVSAANFHMPVLEPFLEVVGEEPWFQVTTLRSFLFLDHTKGCSGIEPV